MIRTQIYLTEEEHSGICELSKATGKRQSELIRLAVDEFLIRKNPEDKLAKIRRAKGMWEDRDDIDVAQLRSDFDRFE